MPRTMRSEVTESWRRSAAAGVDVQDDNASITLPQDSLADYRQAHPLARVFPLLEDVLGQAARSCDAVMALTDASGQLLWVTGKPSVLSKAEGIGFMEGANWDERLAGTNAPGTALALGRPVSVTGEEHFRVAVRPWHCAASPIHDTSTGATLGVLDITGGPAVAVPQTLAMVRAAARLAEAELASVRTGSADGTWLPGSGPETFELHALGRREGLLRRGGHAISLSLRHTEMLIALAHAPLGLSGEEVGALVWPHEVSPSTVRAELNRLRHILGSDMLSSRPYRLHSQVAGDWHAVQGYLASGDVESAVRAYAGPLLPHSEAPDVLEQRRLVEAELRHCILHSQRTDLMGAWTRTSWGADDYDMWIAQGQLLPPSSPLQPLVRSQVARLDDELGA